MLLHCALCGKDLDIGETVTALNNNCPPACVEHMRDVYEEVERDISMWPSDWYGHASMNPEGCWYEKPAPDDFQSHIDRRFDDGDYDGLDDIFKAHRSS